MQLCLFISMSMLLQAILWGGPQWAIPWVHASCIWPAALQAGSEPEQPYHYQHLLHFVRSAGRGEFKGLPWRYKKNCSPKKCFLSVLTSVQSYDKRRMVVFCLNVQNEKTQILSTFLWLRLVSSMKKNPDCCHLGCQKYHPMSKPVFHTLVRIAFGKAKGQWVAFKVTNQFLNSTLCTFTVVLAPWVPGLGPWWVWWRHQDFSACEATLVSRHHCVRVVSFRSTFI